VKVVLLSLAVTLVAVAVLIANVITFSELEVPLSSSSNIAYAQDTATQNRSGNNSTLYVSGNAQTMVKPDKVTLSLSVETTNTTAEEALTANSEAMNNAHEALRAAGVLENETSTSFFNISPNYNVTEDDDEEIPSTETRDIISYTVTNSITIDSFNLLNVSEWIDTAVQAGVNEISSIFFSLSDERSEFVKNDLLKLAVADAQNKANIAASALGLNVTGVESVNIEGADNIPLYPPQPYFAEETSDATSSDGGLPTPIIAGEQQVTSSVSIVFLID
jgi:uncharacterized protein